MSRQPVFDRLLTIFSALTGSTILEILTTSMLVIHSFAILELIRRSNFLREFRDEVHLLSRPILACDLLVFLNDTTEDLDLSIGEGDSRHVVLVQAGNDGTAVSKR